MVQNIIGPIAMKAGQKVASKLGVKFISGFGSCIATSVISNKMSKKLIDECQEISSDENLSEDESIEKRKKVTIKTTVKAAVMNGLVGMAFGGASMEVNKAIDASKFM